MLALLKIGMFLVFVVGTWRLYTKAGQPGWMAFIPILNALGLLKMAGKPVWWIVPMFIPVIHFIPWFFIAQGLSKSFGKGALFGLGLCVLPFVFAPMLGFSDARYLGVRE